MIVVATRTRKRHQFGYPIHHTSFSLHIHDIPLYRHVSLGFALTHWPVWRWTYKGEKLEVSTDSEQVGGHRSGGSEVNKDAFSRGRRTISRMMKVGEDN